MRVALYFIGLKGLKMGVIMEFGFDENTAINKTISTETYEEVTGLRNIRQVMLEAQLADLDGTIDQMIQRGLLDESDRETCRDELAHELMIKLATNNNRMEEDSHMYGDEIALYVDTAEEEIKHHDKFVISLED